MLSELGKRLENIRYDQLPSATIEKAKTAVLNFFGGSLCGADASLVMAEKAVWQSQNCSVDCVILGNQGKTSPLAAAAVNAAMGQVILLEDCHEKTLSHPGVVVIPVAMAIGQSLKASGKQIIEAVVAGYESMGRIGSVLIAPGFPRYGLRPASIMAPFGGAAAAAKLLGLNTEGISRALAIAGNTAAGVMEFVNAGTVDICIQNCFAAKNSILAALLAANGIQAAPTILEGQFGLGLALNQRVLDWSKLVPDDNDEYIIDDTFIKPFPGCGHVLTTAQSAISIVKKHTIDPENVEKVTVGVCRLGKEFPGLDNPGPFSGTISAMMNHGFVVASALVHGEVSTKTVKMYDHPAVARLAERVSVEIDDEIEKAAPHKTGARLTLQLKNGETIIDYQEDLIPLNRDGVIERIRETAQGFIKDRLVVEIIEKTLNIENIHSINSLMNLLESDI